MQKGWVTRTLLRQGWTFGVLLALAGLVSIPLFSASRRGALSVEFSQPVPAPAVKLLTPRIKPLAEIPPSLPPKAEVVVLGVDGVSLNLLRIMIENGVTPGLGQLLKRGAVGPLRSIWPLRTPQVWTSAVTGKYPGQHGIWDHLSNTYFNPPPFRTKKRQRVTTKHLQSKPLWELLDAKGLRTLSVGWVATWPARKLENGVMVAPVELVGDKRQTSIKPSFYRGVSHSVEPKSLAKRVESKLIVPSMISDDDLKPFADIPEDKSKLFGLPRLKRYVYALRWSLARAKSVEALTIDLFKHHRSDVVFSYFQCSDSLLHRFWIFQESEASIKERFLEHGIPDGDIAELKRRFGRVVEGCYRDLDNRISRILDVVAGPDTLVVVLSDHGFGPSPVPHRMPSEPYGGKHLDDGIVMVAGPGVRPGTKFEGASILDITPTLLHFFGHPIAKDMPGKVMEKLFEPGFLEPVEWILSYESTAQLEIPYQDGWPPRHVTTMVELKEIE